MMDSVVTGLLGCQIISMKQHKKTSKVFMGTLFVIFIIVIINMFIKTTVIIFVIIMSSESMFEGIFVSAHCDIKQSIIITASK